MRKTKIVVTIGPSSSSPEILDRFIERGIDCARLNFSHGTLDEHAEVIANIRRLSKKHGRPVAILQDLGGIKLRLGRLEEPVLLNHGDNVSLVPENSTQEAGVLPFPQPGVLRNIEPGHNIFIADGTVRLHVTAASPSRVEATVLSSGVVSSFKGVNLPGVPIDEPVLTEQDKIALQFGVEHGVDWVALSFVRSAEDILYAREHLNAAGSKALVMAKLERGEGVDNIDSILPEVDGIMVARGDLGVEIPMERVTIVQKQLVAKSNEAGKLSVIATQMLWSMVVAPAPTRAEISDVTNAVLDRCDAVMLSDETAMGQYPLEALNMFDATIRETEKIYPYFSDLGSGDRTQAITSAAARLVRSLGAKPVVVTSTGRAAFELSRFRPDQDVLAFSHDSAVLQKLCLGWGIRPGGVIPPQQDMAKLVGSVIKSGLEGGVISETDVVTIVHGFLPGVSGTTNAVQVLDMREYLSQVSAEPAAAAKN
ncbi:MAG: pyruvate kinase [Chloroflexi bacterium]|nr:pyruvate kinase [Chloroflexota bacterium]MDA1272050.1 pyruvate kinase [Chloroflexota bacterium]PKB59292.1 MAG: pyruvate kinase [SAR202 cluster bacterium Casp-Chloro-G2]